MSLFLNDRTDPRSNVYRNAVRWNILEPSRIFSETINNFYQIPMTENDNVINSRCNVRVVNTVTELTVFMKQQWSWSSIVCSQFHTFFNILLNLYQLSLLFFYHPIISRGSVQSVCIILFTILNYPLTLYFLSILARFSFLPIYNILTTCLYFICFLLFHYFRGHFFTSSLAIDPSNRVNRQRFWYIFL